MSLVKIIQYNSLISDMHAQYFKWDVSQHFSSKGYSVEDISILGLIDVSIDSQKRETLEQRIIFKLDTRAPRLRGLNKEFSILWHHLPSLLSALFSNFKFSRHLLDPTVLLNILSVSFSLRFSWFVLLLTKGTARYVYLLLYFLLRC